MRRRLGPLRVRAKESSRSPGGGLRSHRLDRLVLLHGGSLGVAAGLDLCVFQRAPWLGVYLTGGSLLVLWVAAQLPPSDRR